MRALVLIACAGGWAVFAVAVAAPLAGMAWAAGDPSHLPTRIIGTPAPLKLAGYSLALSATATGAALLLGLLPAALLGGCTRRQWPWLLGLVLAPLMIPPQVYAYAWGLIPVGRQLEPVEISVRAGLISAGWLWPVVSLVLAAGIRSTGRRVYQLALLDASRAQAFLRAVLPSLRPQLVAACAIVAGITLIEYAIPHLSLARIWATELMVLVEVRAPYGQVLRMAAQPVAVIATMLALAVLAVRGSGGWLPVSEQDTTPDHFERLNSGPQRGPGAGVWIGSAAVWLLTLGVPVGLMISNLRVPGAWMQALSTFSVQWWDSLQVAVAAGGLSVLLALSTVGLWQASGRRLPRWAALLVLAVAVIPPPALGVGYVVSFNRPGWIGDLYAERPVVWIAALVARYGIVAVLVLWLALGRRRIAAADQARVDGGNSLDILGHVLAPMFWPALLSGGLIVTVLALFEVVVSQLTRPPAYGSIALTVLNYMHYGRDDAVITTSVVLVAVGVVLTQACGHLLTRVRN